MPVVVAVNRFESDTEAELAFVEDTVAREFSVKTVVCDYWARGGARSSRFAQLRPLLLMLAKPGFNLFTPMR